MESECQKQSDAAALGILFVALLEAGVVAVEVLQLLVVN
jgi:hypothetical protein